MASHCSPTPVVRVASSTSLLSFDETDVNPEFLDHITLNVMFDPVITPHGDTFERYALTRWLHEHERCPLTNQQLSLHDHLAPNRVLRRLIDDDPRARQLAQKARERHAATEVAMKPAAIAPAPPPVRDATARRDAINRIARQLFDVRAMLSHKLTRWLPHTAPMQEIFDIVAEAAMREAFDLTEWQLALAPLCLTLPGLLKSWNRRFLDRLRGDSGAVEGQRDALCNVLAAQMWGKAVLRLVSPQQAAVLRPSLAVAAVVPTCSLLRRALPAVSEDSQHGRRLQEVLDLLETQRFAAMTRDV